MDDKFSMKTKKCITIFAAALLSVGLTLSAFAEKPVWKSVPSPLKKSPGVEAYHDWFYATGAASISNIREDKAYELARSKSFNRALQWLRAGNACKSLIQSLPKDKQAPFFDLIDSQMPPLHIEQVQIIRQWETNNHAFTTIAAPITLLTGFECPFSDIRSAIENYLAQPDVSLNGLMFCLNYAPRYSTLAERVRLRTGQYSQQQGLIPVANCFTADKALETSVVPLIFQHNIHRAAEYTIRAQQLSAHGNWPEAIDAVEDALTLVPSYSSAYLLMARYLLEEQHQPELALGAVQKSLRDGCCFIAAMRLNIQCLKELNSAEAQIFEYLLKETQEKGRSNYPVQLSDFLNIQTDTAMADLFVNSAGCAIEGEDRLQDSIFDYALNKFQNAKSDDDVFNVLELLFKALSRQPFSAKTHNLIGACLRHQNQPLLALPFLWQAARLKPDYDLALTNLGICCDQLGQKESAAYYFNHPAVIQSASGWVKERASHFNKMQ